MKISPPRTVKSPAPGKRIPAPAGVGDRFVDSLAKNLKDEAREKAGKLDMDALPQKDGTPVVDLEVLSGTPLRAPRCRNALKERPMTTIDQSDLSRILLALEQGLEVVGELRTSMNEAFAGCRLSGADARHQRTYGSPPRIANRHGCHGWQEATPS